MNTVFCVSSNFVQLQALRPVIKRQHVAIVGVALAAIALVAIALRSVYPAVRIVNSPEAANRPAHETDLQMEEGEEFAPVNPTSLLGDSWNESVLRIVSRPLTITALTSPI